MFQLFVGTASSQEDAPPPALSGRTESAPLFEFASDAQYLPTPRILNWLCNKDKEPLIFDWPKARLARDFYRPLPPGECQRYSIPVAGIRPDVDYEAPVMYTQGKLRQDGAVYLPVDTATTKIESQFSTTYVDASDVKQQVEVTVGYEVTTGNQLQISLTAEPASIVVGLSDNEWLQSSDYAQWDLVRAYKQAAEQGVSFDVLPAYKLLDEKQLSWLGAEDKTNMLTFGGNLAQKFVFPVDLVQNERTELRIIPATLYIFDEKLGLIATGAYSRLSPQ
jgi:hypothetical protein